MNIKDEENNMLPKANEQNNSVCIEQEPDISFSFSQLFKDAGSQSLKALKWFLIVLFSFGILNIIFFIISLLKYGNRPFGGSSLYMLAILFIGLCSTIFALFSTYKYILIDTLGITYKYLTSLFKRICVKIIDKVISGGNRLTGKRDIEKTLNVGSLMIEIYGKQLPNYVKKSVIFILNRIPFSDFLFNMQNDLKSEKKDSKELSEILYIQLDSYINNAFFKKNSMRWMLWLLPLNIIIQTILLIFIK